MPRLILLNGPPAAGKSTLAQLYADDHPLALNLDIDRVRALLGSWRAEQAQAGLAARRIALAAARAHLAAGHDVVVPQLVARLEFIEQLAAAAQDSAATFREVVLLGVREELPARYRERAGDQAAAGPADPAISTDLTDAELTDWHDRLLAVIAARPATVVITTRPGDPGATYQELLARLG